MPEKLFKLANKPFVSSVVRHRNKVNGLRSFKNEQRSVTKKLLKIKEVEEKLAQYGIKFKCVIVNVPNFDERQDELVVDSEDDIQFKTPPTAKKVKKEKNTTEVKSVRSRRAIK